MKNYKYHEYIDNWMLKVERGKVHSCREQKALMPFLRTILDSEEIEIKSKEIYDAVNLMEKYFFELIDFQKFITALIVGVFYKETQLLVFNQIFIMMGRGSGKNGFVSALSFYFMSDKHNIKQYHVDIVATSEEQAQTSFFDVYDIIDENKRIQKLFHYTKEKITFNKTKSTLKFRTSNAKTKDGGRPGCVIFDEIHQYGNYDNIKVFTGGLGKKPRPRRIYITTDGELREAVLDNFKDRAKRILSGEIPHGGFLPIIFKMDSIQEVGKPNLWDKAIPRIEYDLDLKTQIATEYEEMLEDAGMKEAFITKRMNIPYASEDKVAVSWEEILDTKNHEWPDLEGSPCIGTLDYADLKDFASCGLYLKYNGKRFFKQHTFIHYKSLEFTRYNIDINEAVKNGWATIVKDTPIITPGVIAKWFMEQSSTYSIKKVVGDRFRITAIQEAFEEAGIPFEGLFFGSISQNKIHPIVTRMFAERSIALEDDKLMRWYINNTGVKKDGKGNYTYFKIDPKKRKTDGFFSLLHGIHSDDQLEDASIVVEAMEPFVF